MTGTHRHPSSEVILRVHQRASCSCSPPEPRRHPADDGFNPVHLRRRNRDGNEESTGRICDEVRRVAANIAKLLELCSDDFDRSAVRGRPLGCVHQRAGILGRRRRLDLLQPDQSGKQL